ncbi:Lnb N-terminal periplasmic domain-containing protein [Photobacterium sp. J15]|uniref:Lnb N-terminal periplasmic domain-containing protein n=1 Tax=Photobacterium sp. J15 TaxID=265901 RepID=UPI0007E3B390|nr:DUF4105 domain-containing protein [Photobacterium sp. J15]
MHIPSTFKNLISPLVIISASFLSTDVIAESSNYAVGYDELAQHPYWLKLGHYHPNIFSGWQSQIDSSDFFISPEGKKDPLSELKATLDKFNSDEFELYACMYPARFNWLREKLHFNQTMPTCPDLETWKSTLNPKGLTMVFPTAFINNPESMFGHTLLRIDAHNQTKNSELVAYAVNFAADPDSSDNAALFVIKGFAGSYPGYFSVMPYYRKVKEYNDLESRDIWEFPLALSEDEVEKVILHLWELQPAVFDYFYMDENCSYQLLSLLQLAREDLDLVSNFEYSAVPSDTIIALNKHGLISDVSYRASYGTRLLHFASQLNEDELNVASEVMGGDTQSLEQYDDIRRAAILEMAYEWLNFRFYDDPNLDRNTAIETLNKLLIERSRLKVKSPFSPLSEPDLSPIESHGSRRLGIGLTSNKVANDHLNISWRATYHDLLDRSGGFVPGASISFLNTELSVDSEGDTKLNKLYFVDVSALAPDNNIFNSIAWNLRTGFDRQPDDNEWSERWFLRGGIGKAWGDSNQLHSYMLFSGEANTGKITNDHLNAAIGIDAGVVVQFNSDNKMHINAQAYKLFDDDVDYHSKVTIGWQWSPVREWGIRNELGYQEWNGYDAFGKLTMYYYY